MISQTQFTQNTTRSLGCTGIHCGSESAGCVTSHKPQNRKSRVANYWERCRSALLNQWSAAHRWAAKLFQVGRALRKLNACIERFPSLLA